MLLFVSASTSRELIKKAQLACEACGMACQIEVVPVEQNPERAEKHNIQATPQLVRLWPEPVIRLVGDFTDPNQIRQFICI
ncbi:MAG TPA: circadian clock KaiB family protein [Methylomirabilota bacterium]|nr:circadian clock KaiB family protein [Methylomirabilota bacterium]